MEPDVIRIYSSSPPPMEDGAEEEDEDFGDFGTFSGVPNSISFTEFDTPTTFNQTQALTATSPPELLGSRGLVGFGSSNGTLGTELPKANGVVPASHRGVRKGLSSSPELANCNGGEVLTNGFDVQGSPSSQNSVHSHIKLTSTEDSGSAASSPEDNFADFAAFSNAEGHVSQPADEAITDPSEDCTVQQETSSRDYVRDTNRTESDLTQSPDRSCNTDRGGSDSQRDVAPALEAVCTLHPLALNGLDGVNRDGSKEGCSDADLSPADHSEAGQSDEKSSETSLGRPLSTDALEEYDDVSTTGSVPSPPLQGEPATPADHSQLAEDDEDFGEFGDAGSFGGQDFAHFEQPEAQPDESRSQSSAVATGSEQDDDFGDFNSPKFHSDGNQTEDGGRFANLPVSDSFGNFSSADGGEADGGWSAFGEQQDGESWAAFSSEQNVSPVGVRKEEEEDQEEEEEEEWHEGEAAAVSEETSRTDRQTVSLSSRLEKLFQRSFPQTAARPLDDHVVSLKILLEPPEDGPGAENESRSPRSRSGGRGSVWMQLQDIHEALGLRYQWGGSHCNKALLCCLGIDTRNILFTGQKKQPVIVPMYAAGLGMLEPTKEPVKPVSAAEMIASIGQTPPAAPETSSGSSDSVQEALPPVQFDWSSSGLTNPLDASGGSSLLNLDFFGPVEDSGSSSSTSIPGVDPELYELTTSKLDSGISGSRVADAFARLMSTMEKTSTSTRRPRKDENLSQEASKVISALPDLSFMQAKVLMFPTTLTPLGCQATPD
ncbi:aftiphilin a isoform X2 [Amphiprion ocellaris]|uniref:aftiphilin a isoform X2 n=1 Tax=Amphiprion ocellaris TaxID=80972 RepID=UPI002410D70E|nr:aftiphilin a isoform X2 [Amphiprion ocellaris]